MKATTVFIQSRVWRMVAFGVSALLVACGGGGSPSVSATPIKIGGVFSLTGSVAQIVTGYYHDAQLVFDDVNAHGGINGHKLDVSYEDDASDPATGVLVTRKLIDQNGDRILFGGVFTNVALAMVGISDQNNVLFYNPGSTATGLTNPLHKYVFSAAQTADVSSKAIADFIVSMSAKRVGVIAEADAYGDQSVTGITAQLSQRGLKIDSKASIAATAVDATSQVLQMKHDNVDVIVLAVTNNPGVVVIKAMVQQKVGIPIISYGGGIGPAIDSLLTSSAPIEYYVVTDLACPLNGACAQNYVTAYKSRFQDQPTVQSAQGYFATLAFVEALKHAKSYTPDGIKEALETSPPFTNELSPVPIAFSSSNHLGTNAQFLQGYKDGKLYFFGASIQKNQLQS